MANYNSLHLDPNAIPFLLPHISCVGNRLFWGQLFLYNLSDAEAEFLECCDGSKTLAEIAAHIKIDARSVAALSRWVIWWNRTLSPSKNFSEKEKRVVFCASPEDVWIGMGGRLLSDSPRLNTIVLTCFGFVGDTNYPAAFPTMSQVSFVCHDEVRLAAKLAGVENEIWGFPEQKIRERYGSARYFDYELFFDSLKEAIKNALEIHRPTQVFIPAATRHSIDGRILFEILCSLLVDGDLQPDIHIYESKPAAAGHRYTDEFLSQFESSYLAPSEYFVDVTANASRKLSMMDIFKCRLDRKKLNQWKSSGQRNAFLAGQDSKILERFWNINISGF